MKQLSTTELELVSGGTFGLLSLGANAVNAGAQAVTSLFGPCSLIGTLARGVSGAAQTAANVDQAITNAIGGAVGGLVNGVAGLLGGAANISGSVSGSISCGCTTPATPVAPTPTPI